MPGANISPAPAESSNGDARNGSPSSSKALSNSPQAERGSKGGAAGAKQQQQAQRNGQVDDEDREAGPSTSTAHTSTNPRIKKTLADQLAIDQGVAHNRKRKRVHHSCAECHRRKHKCDRNIPCQPCLERGLGDSCRPFSDGDEFGDERDRLKRLEDLVEGLARAHATLSDDFKDLQKERDALLGSGGTAQRRPSAASHALDGEEASGSGSKNGTRGEDKRARMSKTGSLDMEREELRQGSAINDETGQAGLFGAAGNYLPDAGNSLEGGLTREGDSFYGALALPSVSRGVIETQIHGERLELSSNVPLRSASAKVNRLIQEGGASPHVIDELMGCLPSRQESDAMLEWYFRDINDTRLPLHERTFRASYEEIMQWRWGSLKYEEGDDGARHIPFLSFLFVILGIAKHSEPIDRCPSEEQARRGALFYLHCARRSMAIASAVRADHIDVLLAALYGARLLITLRQSAESWSLLGVAIRAAQAIGLHRDGTKLGLDAVTTERRRRLWAMIFYLDRTTSMLLGRPQAIDEKTADTLPPSDVDIDVLPRFGPAPVPPIFPPAEISAGNKMERPPGVFYYIAIRHAMSKLVGRIVEHFQDLSRQRTYADVLQIDADLQHFYEALPGPYLYPALHGDRADRSFDDVCPWLPIHRYVLNIEYHYVRNALHRPYLLRSERYKQSREAAFASAKADRITRREYRREVQWPTDRARSSHLGGVYRKFASALIAGIELLLDPHGPNAPELHEYLDCFLDLSTNSPDGSQCTKRELAIINIFKAKAVDPTWCAATATGAKGARAGANIAKGSAEAKTNGKIANKPSALKSTASAVQDAIVARQAAGPTNSNELAQTLLDRLGGMESLQVLNQNQSPSSSVTSVEPGAAGGAGSGFGSMAQSSTTAALAGLGSLTAPMGLSGSRPRTPRAAAKGRGTAGHAGNGTPSSAHEGTPASYGVSGGLDVLFDGGDGTDWLSFGGNDGGAPFGDGAFSASNAGPPTGSSDGAMSALAGQSATTPTAMSGIFGGSAGSGGYPTTDNDYAGWGALVEAIVSGQEQPAGQGPSSSASG